MPRGSQDQLKHMERYFYTPGTLIDGSWSVKLPAPRINTKAVGNDTDDRSISHNCTKINLLK